MRGDIMNSIRWGEVNDCNSFQDGNKRKVKLYGEVVEDKKFDSEMEAEQRLYKYYREKNKGKLLYEDEEDEEEEKIEENEIKIYFSGNTSDKEFEGFKPHIENLIEHFSYPTLEELEDEDKFFVFFNNGVSYVIRGNQVIIKDQININPKDYYPEDYKQGDPIPSETVNKIIAAKLGIDWKVLRDILNIDSDFHLREKKESFKEKIFNKNK